MKPNLIIIDRDGTLVEDEDYYLGSDPKWKSQIKILPGVAEGIKILNLLSNTYLAIITNQAGVALKGSQFDELTLERAVEVNDYIMAKLAEQGAIIQAQFICPYVSEDYVEKALQKGRSVNSQYVHTNHPDAKPNVGLIQKAARYFGHALEDYNVHIIGDRLSDVEMALRVNGQGHLVTSWKTRQVGDEEKVKALSQIHPQILHIYNNFLEAAHYISSNKTN
ncbi:MAG: hypothetical protein Q8Q31_02920 [Nanoarchaeota archaeon]|nr:hypothetical protein [Nanoarchaeota archaeon]